MTKPPAVIAITQGMVDAGLEVMEDMTNDMEAEDYSDTQLVVAIFTRMWQHRLAEEEAIRRGERPKLTLIKNTLVLPNTAKKH